MAKFILNPETDRYRVGNWVAHNIQNIRAGHPSEVYETNEDGTIDGWDSGNVGSWHREGDSLIIEIYE